MNYMGGKFRLAKQIVGNFPDLKGRAYFEPCVGGLNIAPRVECDTAILGDVNLGLINMWQAVYDGWIPPDVVTEDDYKRIKAEDNREDPMWAFAGIGVSWGGKLWGGYARKTTAQDYAKCAKNACLKKIKNLKDVAGEVKFIHFDMFEDEWPEFDFAYIDPPYAGTTSYWEVGKFDSERMWSKVSSHPNSKNILVSEFNAPEEFEVVWQKELSNKLNDGRMTEKLFRVK